MRSPSSIERIRRASDAALLVATLLIANRWTWLCVFEINKPLFWCQYGTPVSELAVYLGLAGIVLLLLWRAPLGTTWLGLWKGNMVLVLFLALCAASVFWSIAPVSTVYRFLVVLLSAIVASYLGLRLTQLQWIRFLTWFFAAAILISYILVGLLPGAAIMHAIGLDGSWRGVFSHRNYAGSILAYGAGVLLLSLLSHRRALARVIIGALLALDIILIYFTRSATGAILLLVLLVTVSIGAAWQRYRSHLRTPHYAALGTTLLLAGLLVAVFRNKIFALLGRSSTLTGRIPLWGYLVERVMDQNPWLGYGLWTVWRFQNFRREAQAAVGWPIEVIDAHNGYVDVLLFLGVIGLGLLVATLARALWQSVAHTVMARTVDSLWPAFTLVYVIVANITISFFFQFETFHWVLLVASIFVVTSAGERLAASSAVGDAETAAINA